MQESLKTYWWEEPKGQVHETVFSIIRHLTQNQSYRHEANLRNMRLYGNLNVLGLTAKTYAQSANATDRVTFNIIQSVCDTKNQKIAKNKVKPTFLTSGGDYGLKKKAKLLEKFVQGQFYATRFHERAPRTHLDGEVFGTGALKIYREKFEIIAERTFMDELLVDDAEAIYGRPRSLFQTKVMSREVLCRLYPEYKSKIMECQRAEDFGVNHQSLSNPVLVSEAWHLPSGQGAKDGRHIICIENQDFLDEAWEKDYFPFVFTRSQERLLGFFGQGAAERLTGIQVEINKILKTIQLSFHLCGIPQWWFQNGSKLISAKMNNQVGQINSVSGEMPELHTAAPVNPQLFEHLERLIQKAYQQEGVSEMAAQSQKPAGLDSGKALRTYNDIEAERFILQGQAWEQLHLDAAKQMIALGKEIDQEMREQDENSDGYSVTVKGRKFIEKIKWADIDLEEDEYLMQCFPTSTLSSTPAGRLQDVQDLMQAGFIDKANGMRLLDFPDLESYMSLANAAIEDIEAQIESMVDQGKYMPPEPFQNLDLGIQMMQSAYLKAKNDNVEEKNLELLRRWMAQAEKMLSNSQAQAVPAQAGMPGGQPQAVPQAPPTSGLLPNAPAGVPAGA